MKKIIILILVVFLLTGCDAIYYAEIKDGTILEYTNFLIDDYDNKSTGNISSEKDLFYDPMGVYANNKSVDELIDDYYQQDYLAFNNGNKTKLYEKERISYEDRLGLQLKYSYSFSNFQKSSMINYCFDNVSVNKKGNYLIINLKDSYKCFNQDVYTEYGLNTLDIKVIADNVFEHNADSVSDNVYTWSLSSNNTDKEIYLKAKVDDNSHSLIIIILICIICGIASFFVVYKLSTKAKKK